MAGPLQFITDILSGGTNTTVEAPEMSDEEKQFLNQINEALASQQAYYDQMMPIFAHQMHYKLVGEEGSVPQDLLDQQSELQSEIDKLNEKVSGGGWGFENVTKDKIADLEDQLNSVNSQIEGYQKTQKWVKMTDEEWYNDSQTTDTERRQWDIYQGQMDRYQKALAGELPLTEQMTQQKADEFKQLKGMLGITGDTPETARAQDTISAQQLAAFNKKWSTAEEQQRYNELGTAGQGYTNITALAQNVPAQNVGTMQNLGNIYGNTIQGYGSLLQPYQAYNQMAYNAQAQNQATQAQMYGSTLNLAGLLGMAAIV